MKELNLEIHAQEETQEINKNDNMVLETDGEEMEIGDLDLDGLEAACSKKIPDHIPSQQVSLLEKAIIKAKAMKFLEVAAKSIKDLDGKKKGKK